MEIVGIIATALAGIVGLTAIVLFVRSIPDLARYRRIRRM